MAKIGEILPPSGAALAPMAGVTDLPFRILCREMGAAWCVTEMISAKGYLCAPKARATRELLARDGREGITGLQIFGHEPELMAEAANQLQDRGFAFVDINMGCPAHKIVGNGDGCALMRDTILAGRIVAAVAKAVKRPVTVKIRAGWQDENAAEIARVAEDNGARAITVHPRTRDQFYAGRADWDVIGRVVRAVGIPVIGNGDIFTGADAARMAAQTGCAAVAIGRGAQGNPWIFREALAALNGLEPPPPPSFAERAAMAIRHLDMEIAMRGEKSAVLEMRKHIAWYLSGAKGCVKARARINALDSAALVREALEEFITKNGEA